MAHKVELKFNREATSREEIHAAIELVITGIRGGRVEFCNTCGLGGIDMYLTGLEAADFAAQPQTIPGIVSVSVEKTD